MLACWIELSGTVELTAPHAEGCLRNRYEPSVSWFRATSALAFRIVPLRLTSLRRPASQYSANVGAQACARRHTHRIAKFVGRLQALTLDCHRAI